MHILLARSSSPRTAPESPASPKSATQTNAAARAYRVYHSKTGEDKDYLVDHSIITYLLDPQGNFVTFFGKNMTAPEVAKALVGFVGPKA